MIVLGISQIPGAIEITHDNAAALICDGEIIAAAEEERFDRSKHSRRAPKRSMQYCLDFAGISLKDVDYIAVGNSPFCIFKARLFDCNPQRLLKKILYCTHTEYRRRKLRKSTEAVVQYVAHHLSHAALGFYTSGFSEANVLVVDGAGESETFSFFIGRNGALKPIWKIPTGRNFQHSIGGVYHDITDLLRLGKYGQGKTMALASFGEPKRGDMLSAFNVQNHKQFAIDRIKMRSLLREFHRHSEDQEFTQDQKNIAATVQLALEQNISRLAREAFAFSGIKNFVLSGGVALNCNMNSKILSLPECGELFVAPPTNDGGIALGAALHVSNLVSRHQPKRLIHPYYGPEFDNAAIEKALKKAKLRYEKYDNIEQVAAQCLCSGKILGWFQGRMEIGPRALGNRSILADATKMGANDYINREVKDREPWRPFGASVTQESAAKFFEGIDEVDESPFMLQTFFLKEKYRKSLSSIVHVDGSSRIQTVREEQNLRFYKLLKSVEAINGYPIVLNTSFNTREEPIVCSPSDALSCFFRSGLDILVLGNCMIEKPSLCQ